jgi:SPP1 family predicted phage head-tail adaptor
MRPKKTGAGDFPFRMTIQRDVGTTRDAAGRVTPVWQDYQKVWGGEEITTGREFAQAQQVKADITSIVKCRYVDGVTSKMRVIPKTGSSRQLQIIAVRDIGSFGVELELWCKEAL